MILDTLANWRLYEGLSELRHAFEFLGKGGFDQGASRIEIDGSRLFALPQTYTPKALAEGRFEAHRRYADIQYVISGAEMMGYAPLEALAVETPYDGEKDIEFYHKPEAFSRLVVAGGSFAVFYPQDGHMPGIRIGDADGAVQKVVMKVLLP